MNVIDKCIHMGLIPKSLLKHLREVLVMSLESVENKLSRSMIRSKIRFYTHLHNGDKTKARAALDKLKTQCHQMLDDIMFGAKQECAIVGGEPSEDIPDLSILYKSNCDDENAVKMGNTMKEQIERCEAILRCELKH